MSLAVTPSGSLPFTVTRMFLDSGHAASGSPAHARLREVPMPKASAPNAPWVEVWLSPQTMVVPGRVQPCSGPMMCTMPWRISSMGKYSTPKSRGILFQGFDLLRDSGSVMPLSRSLVGTLWSATARVSSGRRTLRPVSAQAFEGLGAGHFMHQMPVDIEDGRLARRVVHQMRVPDLVVQRLGHGCLTIVILLRGLGEGGLHISRRGRFKSVHRSDCRKIQHRHDDDDGDELG